VTIWLAVLPAVGNLTAQKPPAQTNFVPPDYPGIVGRNSTGLFIMDLNTKAVPCKDDPGVVCNVLNFTKTFIPNNSNSALPPSPSPPPP
jgi:hypothetical protein